MSIRLQFPRGGAFSFTRQFVVGGSPLDLTAATLAGYLKYSPDDAVAAALATLAVAPLVAANGTVAVALTGAQTAALPLGVPCHFYLTATIAGAIYAPENCQGQVILTPLDVALQSLLSDLGLTENLTPEETPSTYEAAGLAVINRPDLTGLTGGTADKLDALVTALSITYPVNTIVILSYGLVSQIWKLVAGTDAEAPTATPAIVRPDDYNATTNAVVWKQIG